MDKFLPFLLFICLVFAVKGSLVGKQDDTSSRDVRERGHIVMSKPGRNWRNSEADSDVSGKRAWHLVSHNGQFYYKRRLGSSRAAKLQHTSRSRDLDVGNRRELSKIYGKRALVYGKRKWAGESDVYGKRSEVYGKRRLAHGNAHGNKERGVYGKKAGRQYAVYGKRKLSAVYGKRRPDGQRFLADWRYAIPMKMTKRNEEAVEATAPQEVLLLVGEVEDGERNMKDYRKRSRRGGNKLARLSKGELDKWRMLVKSMRGRGGR